MQTISRVLAPLAVLALVTAGGPALYCAQARAHAMPCCKTPVRCDLGMKAAPCCAVDPASGFPGTIAVAGADSVRTGPEKAPHASWAAPAEARADSILPAHAARLWYPPARRSPVPIYLRHLSILC